MGAESHTHWLLYLLEILSALFVFVIGTAALAVAVLAVIDLTQRRDAVRRNYPVLGRLRGVLEHLGRFFRHYVAALDREELPFNRAERRWVYRAAAGARPVAAFGSTRDLRPAGTVYFVNAPFPAPEGEPREPSTVTVGPHCARPYRTAGLFHASAMSYGALSRPAVLALSHGARMAGCWLNTGEGGLAPAHLDGGCDLVFQIGTAKFGVRDAAGRLDPQALRRVAAHEQVRMVEIKLAQGAKPGKGGILPAAKVTPEIAAIRGIPPWRDAVSPPRHPEIAGPADLLDMVERVRDLTGLPTGFKTVLGGDRWLDALCEEILRRGPEHAPDFVTVDGAEGGSGAAPASLMDAVGLPIREALPLAVDTLIAAGLRGRVRVIASGRLVTPVGVAWALCAGADFVCSARGFMFALGCIQAMRCDRNTCPTGVTTHDPRRQRGLDPRDKALRVRDYVRAVEREVRLIAHACGAREPRDLERRHVRVSLGDGRSVSFEQLFPYPGAGPPAAAGQA